MPGSNSINSTHESIPVQLELEGEGGLDVPVEDVLLEVVESPEGEVLGELLLPPHDEGHPPQLLLLQLAKVLPTEHLEHLTQLVVVGAVICKFESFCHT